MIASELDRLDCLVVGHIQSSIREGSGTLATHSGSSIEARTNLLHTELGYFNPNDLFSRLAEDCYGLTVTPNPFNAPHAGALAIARYLMSDGLSASVLNFVDSAESLFSAVEKFRPRCIALTTTYYVDDLALKWITHQLREISDAVLIIGGPHVLRTVARGNSRAVERWRTWGISYAVVDALGERTLALLVKSVVGGRSIAVHLLPNLLILNQSKIVATRREPEAPVALAGGSWSPFTDVFNPRVAFVRTAKGCAFQCAFCNYPVLAGEHELQDIQLVLSELLELREMGVRHIAFVDDTFNVPPDRFRRLLKAMIEARLNIEWVSFLRCGALAEQDVHLMAESGCQAVYLGIESGDERILKNMNKAARIGTYERGISWLRAAGIITMASYIIGYPGETASSVQATFDFIERTAADFFKLQLYYHDSTAPIEKDREKYELTGSDYGWSHSTMSWVEAAEYVLDGTADIGGSVPLPLHNYSIWSLPYYSALGFSADTFRSYSKVYGRALQAGIRSPLNMSALTGEFERAVAELELQRVARKGSWR